jgi:hypothetical protein
MNSSRSSRRLDLNFKGADSSVSNTTGNVIIDSRPKKEELRELFREEIDFIIENEKNNLENKIRKELEEEYGAIKNEAEKTFDEKLAALENIKIEFNALIASIKKSYQEKISEDIHMLDEMVTEITIGSLYKIIGDTEVYKELISKNICEVLEKKSAGHSALIKVSEGEMKFLKKEFSDSAWIDCLRLDEKLTDGEMVLDDGMSSLYEIGFVNQLDVLRAAFIKLLRERHAD